MYKQLCGPIQQIDRVSQLIGWPASQRDEVSQHNLWAGPSTIWNEVGWHNLWAGTTNGLAQEYTTHGWASQRDEASQTDEVGQHNSWTGPSMIWNEMAQLMDGPVQ
ncbi:hypothetical protein EDD16DRAFT_1522317 [Pisolithus croceorrhizus]|nr:hypothetical protein EDD16DRAFT_1522317 [Pisolithus croceorrhizus]KAI6156323.1 hypothetical protein EDD17DRAFT_1512512 [Pisolithus thermaeus]